eukprot:m.24494 g.24494  ORF g.24494 m.24494 type:complete len:1144 (+) comp4281_c0_seq1:414-3845(+)
MAAQLPSAAADALWASEDEAEDDHLAAASGAAQAGGPGPSPLASTVVIVPADSHPLEPPFADNTGSASGMEDGSLNQPSAASPSTTASETESSGHSPAQAASHLLEAPSSSTTGTASVGSAPSPTSQRRRLQLNRSHTLVSATYLGCCEVDAPSSATEMNRNIARLTSDPPPTARPVLVCIPRLVGGKINIVDAHSSALIADFPVARIVFCAGTASDDTCFGFTSDICQREQPELAADDDGDDGAGNEEESEGGERTGNSGSQADDGNDGSIDDSDANRRVAPSEGAGAAKPPAALTGRLRAPTPPPHGGLSNDDLQVLSSENSDAVCGSVFRPTSSSRPLTGAGQQFFCHIFKVADVAQKDFALKCMSQAFGRHFQDSTKESEALTYDFEFAMGVCEDDAKGDFAPCPLGKDFFKLRLDHSRRITVTLTQMSAQSPVIDSAFGLLVAENEPPVEGEEESEGVAKATAAADDKRLIPLNMLSAVPDGHTYTITGEWEANGSLLAETAKDLTLDFSLAIDLVFLGLADPVRVVRSFKARVYKATERFWVYGKLKSLPRLYQIKLGLKPSSTGVMEYSLAEVVEQQAQKTSYSNYMAKFNKMLKQVTEWRGTEEDLIKELEADAENEEDEPVVSGSGSVAREFTGSSLEEWNDLLTRWDTLSKKSRAQAVRRGLPDALRNLVWPRLCNAQDTNLVDQYRYLLNQESPTEQVLLRDMTRTFPAHEFFKEVGGDGQTRLYNVNKAYSVYDMEIGYCQGLSFISAVLLLHMPEEEAFTVFVKIMYDYGVREMFKSGFELLQLKFYQLTKLLEELLPDLARHFEAQGVEVHMFASQWFLTLFAAKFSLPVVFRVMDVFLAEDINVLFNIALALLKGAQKDLLGMEYEDILNFFRLSLPRMYQSDSAANALVNLAMRMKVTQKRLNRYEKDYYAMLEEQARETDPVQRLETENEKLKANLLRLEAETETLARELVNKKIAMRHEQDRLEDVNRDLTNQVRVLTAQLQQMSADVEDRSTDANQVKDLYRKTVAAHEEEKQGLLRDHEQLQAEHERLKKRLERDQEELDRQIKINEARAALEAGDVDLMKLQQRVHEMEVALAQEKLKLVDSECRNQALEQQLAAANAAASEAATRRKSGMGGWFSSSKGSK